MWGAVIARADRSRLPPNTSAGEDALGGDCWIRYDWITGPSMGHIHREGAPDERL